MESFQDKDTAMAFALEKLSAGYLGVGLGTLPGAALPEEVTTADLWNLSMRSSTRL